MPSVGRLVVGRWCEAELRLAENRLSSAGVRALAASPALRELSELDGQRARARATYACPARWPPPWPQRPAWRCYASDVVYPSASRVCVHGPDELLGRQGRRTR